MSQPSRYSGAWPQLGILGTVRSGRRLMWNIHCGADARVFRRAEFAGIPCALRSGATSARQGKRFLNRLLSDASRY